jgi:hypothetical protein
MDKLTEQRLAEIEALIPPLFPGPWWIERRRGGATLIYDNALPILTVLCNDDDLAPFVSAVRTAVPDLLAEIKRLSAEPTAVWWLDLDGELADPEVFRTESVAKDDAVRTHRDANQIGLFADDPEPVFDWRKHRDGGTELYVDGEATGMIVRQLTVKDAATAVTTNG